MTENMWFGKPRMLECFECKKSRPFTLKQISVKKENSFIIGYVTMRVDMTYVCCACGSTHTLFNSRNVLDEPDAEKKFKEEINHNKKMPVYEEVDPVKYIKQSTEGKVIVALKTLGKKGGNLEKIKHMCIRLSKGLFSDKDVEDVDRYLKMIPDGIIGKGLYTQVDGSGDDIKYSLDYNSRFITDMNKIYYDVCDFGVGDE